MHISEKMLLALEMIENGEVMQEFEDFVWIKLHRFEWETILDLNEGLEDEQ